MPAAGAPTALRTTSTTRSCCSAAMPAQSGTREVLARHLLGHRQVALGVAEIAERGLEMQRRQVVLRVPDPGLAERGANLVAALGAADEEVVDVARLVLGSVAELADPELAIPLGGLAAQLRPAVELAEEDPQHSRLDLVEAGVAADELERRLRLRAVEAEHPDPLGELRVVHRDEAAVAEPEEVLRRIEAEGRRDPVPGDRGRAEGLRGVLDQRQPEGSASASSGAGRPKRCTGMIAFVLGPSFRSTSAGSRLSVAGVDVGEHGSRAGAGDRLGRRVEREGRTDHLVARLAPRARSGRARARRCRSRRRSSRASRGRRRPPPRTRRRSARRRTCRPREPRRRPP